VANELSHCRNCGSRLEFHARFCGNCGYDLHSADDAFLSAAVDLDLDDPVIKPQKFFRGREAELEIAPRLARAAINHRGSVWWITGPVGVGKSAFINQLVPFFNKNDFLVIRIAASPEFSNLTYYPFQQLVNKIVGITEQTPKPRIPGLLAKLDDYGLSQIDQLYLRHLYPVDLPTTINQRLEDTVRLTGLAAAIVHLLMKLAGTKPLALVIDQLEHADPFTQRLINTLQLVVQQERLLVILVGHESFSTTGDLSNVETTVLEPLRMADIISIARIYAKADRLPAEVEEALFDSTEGIPLAVFLLIDYLKEKDFLVERGRQIRVNEKHRGMVFPQGLDAILATRLALMRPHIQELLWLIAISGAECTTDLLRSIYSYPEYIKEDLEELAEKHLIRSSTLGSFRRVAFTHNHIHDFIYSRIPASGLSTLHPKVAMYIQLQEPLHVYMKTWLAIIHMTHQHERSEQAVQFLERAGDSLTSHLHFLLAVQCYRRESQLLREMIKEPRFEIKVYERKLMLVLFKLARCYRAIADIEHAEKIYRLVVGMATNLDAGFMKIDALTELGEFLLKHNQAEASKLCLEEALLEAEKQRDDAIISQVKWKLGEWYRRIGPLKEAELILADARELADPLDEDIHPNNRWLAAILFVLGMVKMDQKNEQEALSLLVSSLDRAMASRNIPLLIRSVERLAVLYGHKGDHDSGLGFIKLGLRIARDVGDRLSLANLSYQAGRFLMNSQNRQEAEVAFFDTLQLCREINWQQGMEMSQMALSRLRKETV
jgi:tetratricopeptide (TPR) repeat protein